MAISPPARHLRATLIVPQRVAEMLGITIAGVSNMIPVAIYMTTSPMGDDLIVAFKINGVWQDMTKPTGAPGVTDGPKFLIDERAKIVTYIKANGAKAWIMKELMNWITDFVRSLLISLGMSASNAPTPNDDVHIGNVLDVINASLESDFVLEDRNGDGIPEMHAK